jgi:hypothetical protein
MVLERLPAGIMRDFPFLVSTGTGDPQCEQNALIKYFADASSYLTILNSPLSHRMLSGLVKIFAANAVPVE